jgi:hypothetical protein
MRGFHKRSLLLSGQGFHRSQANMFAMQSEAVGVL